MANGEVDLFKNQSLLILFIFAGLMNHSHSKEISEGDILRRVGVINELGYLSFIDEMKILSDMSKNYIQAKSDECSGEFLSHITNSNGEKVVKKKRLSKKEKKLCLYMLINFRIQFTRLAYSARKKHLVLMQKQQTEELRALEQRRLNELGKLAKKYR